MEQANPYTMTPAALASADARATFLQKTYTLLLLGILGFAATLWAAANVPAVNSLAVSLWRTKPWILLIALIAASWLVHAVAEKSPINLIAYAVYVFLFGILLAPLVLSVAGQANGAQTLTQASLITALVFSGLTGYVFVSGKDFSFLGGALAIALFALLGIAIAGWIFGFSVGIWYSVIAVLVFAGYILYDTSKVLHHYPVTAHVSAAIVLFVDVVLLFKHILILLSRRR